MSWWEAANAAFITVAIGALQWVRHKLAAAEREERETRLRNGHRGDGRHSVREDQKTSFFDQVPSDLRRLAVTMIDTQLTPYLVDQWRCGLIF